ncbi:hypothetical protein BKP35_02045 [Anaerobacillus arseniciselenatis]|uniref:RNA polymerase sigma factor 70 region 1.1 domain-containing protein n=1 Tax=Anaerobacillus arseniciselenatis TaxID=85682 RepID=A0A1S2LTX2_9BACI|nr:hypothetical protein [Anaerobacillus arseniciselenatis]OIJ15796.1 hypothetical protein BKP35_02045 [Anaerobacillus arseniciselenatis]
MNKEDILKTLEERSLTDIIELVEDAESGHLEELELVESVGLLYDESLNKEVIELLQQLGVKIIYVTDDEE